MIFKKIEVKKKSVYVTEQIIKAIRDGAYKVGEKLPPERVLTEKMGVSRPLIREALSALEISNILETKVGSGTYVRKMIRNNAEIEQQILSILDKGDPIEALEARIPIEEGLVRLAAIRATPEDLKKIEDALERGRYAGESQDHNSFEKADEDFHLAIAKASRNILLETAVRPIINIMKSELWGKMKNLYFNKEDFDKTIGEHMQIFIAIKRGSAYHASKMMRKHLSSSKDRFIGIK